MSAHVNPTPGHDDSNTRPQWDRDLADPLHEWRRLMRQEAALRGRIHEVNARIIADLETLPERVEMRAKLALANDLLTRMRSLLGES